MKLPTRLPMLVMAAGLLLTVVPSGRGQPMAGQPDEATLGRLRAAKTVRLEVTQRYDRDETSGDDDETAGKTAPLQVVLPLAEEARRVCELLGLRVLAVGQADLTLGINVQGSPESGDYNRIGRQYAGANLGGEITLRDRAGRLLVQEFSFTYEKPEMIVYQIRVGAIAVTGPHPRPESAPFRRTLPGYQCALLELAARGWGEGMLERALKVTGGTLPAAAACVLGETGGKALRAAVPGLIAQLQAESAEARAAAAWALGQSGDPAALAPLLAALDEPGRWPGERTVPDLPDDLPDPMTETAASFGLHFAGQEGREVFQHDFTRGQLANHYIYAAILGLEEKKAAPDLIALLMAALREGRTADRRAGAAILLGELRAAPAREALQTALRDKTQAVRGCTVVALATLDDPLAADAVLAATLDEHPLVRQKAEELLPGLPGDFWLTLMKAAGHQPGATGRDFPREALYAALAAGGPYLRWRALEHLPAPADDAEWRMLLAALPDRHPAVRRSALIRLEGFPDIRPARPALLAALRDNDAEARANALRALGKVSEPADLDRVLTLAKDEAEAVRTELMALLGRFTGPRAVQALLAGLSDGHPDVQATATEALGAHPDPGVTPLLLAELARLGDEPVLAANAVVALGAREDPRAIGPLVDLLAQAERRGRATEGKGGRTTEEDGQIEEEDTTDSLETGLRDALHRLTGQQFDRAEDWRRWWEENRASIAPRK